MVEYIIDGCNFIKAFPETARRDFEGAKESFISRLQSYAHGREVHLTVVFDSRRPSFESFGKVTIIHTGDADRRIIREIGSRASPKALITVSNDVALVQGASSRGTKSMSVEEFDAFLRKKASGIKKSPKGREKPTTRNMTDHDINWWKKELGLE